MAIVLDTIKVPLQKTDEFAKFAQEVRDLSSKRPKDIESIVQQLSNEQKALLKELLKTKRIVVGSGVQQPQTQAQNRGEDGNNPVPRKIVTI